MVSQDGAAFLGGLVIVVVMQLPFLRLLHKYSFDKLAYCRLSAISFVFCALG
jgi:hypothetical protein